MTIPDIVRRTSETPQVSVLMAVHNGLPYLQGSIESVLSQTFDDFEFIVIDDGSTDGSRTILDEYAERDARVRVFHQENVGLTISLNRGIKHARAPLIARMDADDVSMPNRLHRLVEVAGARPAATVVTSNIRMIHQNTGRSHIVDRAARADLANWLLLFYNYVGSHGPALLRRELLQQIGGYDESIVTAQDYDLWTRIVRTGGVVILDEPLYVYRVHDEAVSSTRAASQTRSLVSISQRNIRERLGLELSEQDVQLLQMFWLGGWSAAYSTMPKPSEAVRVDRLLNAATSRYIERIGDVPKHLLRQSVGLRYLDWAASLGDRRTKDSLRLLAIAIRWDPGVLRLLAKRWSSRLAKKRRPQS